MNLNYTEADNKFRKEIKDFIRDNLSQEVQKRVSNGGKYTKDEILRRQRRLLDGIKSVRNLCFR